MQLKLMLALVLFTAYIASCKSSNSPTKISFCDTVCMKDSIKFMDSSKLKPYVYISASNCTGDTLTWGYTGQNKNIAFNYKLNKDYVRCYFKDTAYALLVFNTCENGRGYFMKFSFGKKASFTKSSSAVNNFDPKFSVANGLLVYTDLGNIFVDDIATGKEELMTFGQRVDFDYDAIHETLDSVNITPTRIWAKFKLNGAWQVKEKSISFK